MATVFSAKLAPGGYPVRPGVPSNPRDRAAISANQRYVPAAYTADGAIAIVPGVHILSKTSAAAMTLAAPVAGTDDGMRLTIQAGTAFAHVVTATGLIQDGVTGGAKNTYTTAAFVGSGCELVAYNAKWHLISKNLGSTA